MPQNLSKIKKYTRGVSMRERVTDLIGHLHLILISFISVR